MVFPKKAKLFWRQIFKIFPTPSRNKCTIWVHLLWKHNSLCWVCPFSWGWWFCCARGKELLQEALKWPELINPMEDFDEKRTETLDGTHYSIRREQRMRHGSNACSAGRSTGFWSSWSFQGRSFFSQSICFSACQKTQSGTNASANPAPSFHHSHNGWKLNFEQTRRGWRNRWDCQ